MSGTVFSQPNRIVGEHVDRPELRQRRQPDRGAHVVGENQEGAAKRDEAAVQRDSVERRAHRVLADTKVEITPGA